MSETLDKQTLTRLAWLTELRRQGHRKCEGDFGDYLTGGSVCAIGLLIEVADLGGWDDEFDVGEAAGLERWMVVQVVDRNDGDAPYHEHTFAEIADVVEGWFKS